MIFGAYDQVYHVAPVFLYNPILYIPLTIAVQDLLDDGSYHKKLNYY